MRRLALGGRQTQSCYTPRKTAPAGQRLLYNMTAALLPSYLQSWSLEVMAVHSIAATIHGSVTEKRTHRVHRTGVRLFCIDGAVSVPNTRCQLIQNHACPKIIICKTLFLLAIAQTVHWIRGRDGKSCQIATKEHHWVFTCLNEQVLSHKRVGRTQDPRRRSSL